MRRDRAVLVVVLLVAAGLRLARLGDAPFGMHPDEGHNALDALAIAGGWRPAFLPGNNGREALFMYLMAVTVAIGGPTVWAVRLAGALAGILYVPAQYVLARALPIPRRAALAAAAVAAVSFWPVAQSRYALRAGLLPVWFALALWAWWRATGGGRAPGAAPPADADPPGSRAGEGARDRAGGRASAARLVAGRGARWAPIRYTARHGAAAWGALAGVFTAAAIHTHLTGRLLPLVLTVGAAVAARRGVRRPAIALASALVVALALSSPQIVYFARHPEMLSYRADQVSVLNPEVGEGDPVGTVATNLVRLARAPLLQGDSSWYHNLRRRPIFDPLIGLAFAVGAAALLVDAAGRGGARRREAAILLGVALAAAVAPSALSAGAPNYVRLTATWPALFVAAGIGLDRIGRWVSGRTGGGARAGSIVVAGLVAAGGLLAARDYFQRYVDRPEVYQAFGGQAVERGRLLAQVARTGPTYVTPNVWRQSVVRFLNAQSPPTAVDLAAGLPVPDADVVRYALDPAETELAERIRASWNGVAGSSLDAGGAPVLLVLHASPARVVAGMPPPPAPISFGGRVAVDRVGLPAAVRSGSAVTVTVLLRALAPTDVDHNLFVHVVDASGRTIAQHDGPPLGGTHGTDAWRAGERFLVPVPVALPADAAGTAEVRAGLYDWRDGERLAVPGDDDGAALLGRVQIVYSKRRRRGYAPRPMPTHGPPDTLSPQASEMARAPRQDRYEETRDDAPRHAPRGGTGPPARPDPAGGGEAEHPQGAPAEAAQPAASGAHGPHADVAAGVAPTTSSTTQHDTRRE